MRIMYRYFSLFLTLVLLTLPAGAEPGIVSEYGNFTEESRWNVIQNASQSYFYSDSNLTYVSAGEVEGNEEETYADNPVKNITFLTNTPELELFPVWTADGNYIMYTVQRDGSGNSESYIMKADGSEIEKTNIMEGNLTGFSDINPSGTELILTKSTGYQTGLYLANLENGTVSRVADESDKSEGWGDWCRLGRKIVYTQESAGSPSQLWIVDRDGSNKTRLGTSENIGVGKDWCPLGLKIIYSAKNSKEKPDLWTIEWHGTNQTQLTDTPYGEWNPSYSPDGKKIVYVSDEGGKPEIWLRDTEGNYRIQLTNNIGMLYSNPKWSPDGSKIVFAANKLQNILDNSTVNISSSVLLNNYSNSMIMDYSTIANNSTITSNSVLEDNSVIVNNSITVNNSIQNEPIVNNLIANNSILENNSVIDNSASTLENVSNNSLLENVSNNSLTSGSDIAVIELESSPSTSLLPTVTSVKVDSVHGASEVETVNVSILNPQILSE